MFCILFAYYVPIFLPNFTLFLSVFYSLLFYLIFCDFTTNFMIIYLIYWSSGLSPPATLIYQNSLKSCVLTACQSKFLRRMRRNSKTSKHLPQYLLFCLYFLTFHCLFKPFLYFRYILL